MYILIIRDNTENWYVTDVFQHSSALVEQPHVATELVDDDALDEFPVLGGLQRDTSIDGSKHSSSVNITHQDDVGFGMAGHRQIHQVCFPEVDF